MADTKISGLTAAGSAADANEFPINEAGASKKVTLTQIETQIMLTPTLTSPIIAAGSSSAASKMTIANGTLLATPEANAIENDGTAWYHTLNTTEGRTQDCNQAIFRLTADQGTVGTTIADFFTSTSSYPTVTNGVYEFNWYLWFLKTTAGTATFTITNTQTYTNINAVCRIGPAAGIQATGTLTTFGIDKITTAAAALPASASLSNAVEHCAHIHAIVECATAGNIRLRITQSAGTVTARRGCYYTVRRLFAGNVGAFVA